MTPKIDIPVNTTYELELSGDITVMDIEGEGSIVIEVTGAPSETVNWQIRDPYLIIWEDCFKDTYEILGGDFWKR